jgi:hypothetical protein
VSSSVVTIASPLGNSNSLVQLYNSLSQWVPVAWWWLNFASRGANPSGWLRASKWRSHMHGQNDYWQTDSYTNCNSDLFMHSANINIVIFRHETRVSRLHDATPIVQVSIQTRCFVYGIANIAKSFRLLNQVSTAHCVLIFTSRDTNTNYLNITYLFAYLLIYLPQGAESFSRS